MSYDSSKDTLDHISKVAEFITTLAADLIAKASVHDASKLIEPEKSIFDEYTPKLAGSTYGSDEYKGYLKGMGMGLQHHYSENRHHPEHFENGIMDMTLVDLCEMIADWKAATLRHNNGDIFRSIELNQSRFKYSDELKQILINTVKAYF
jgi:hypothetical protein